MFLCIYRQILNFLGMAGEIKAETEGLLVVNGVDTKEFSAEALSTLPIRDGSRWEITEVV